MRILALSTAVTALTHQKGVEGNESLINTEDVRTEFGIRAVPKLSGNAIRNRLIRQPAAGYLVEALGLSGELTRDVLNLLYHGGIKRVAAMRPDMTKIADMQRLFPIFDLLGCCLPEDIVSGKLVAIPGILACSENMSRIKAIVPDDWKTGSGIAGASSFVSRWQYVRGKLDHETAKTATEDDGESKMMPYAGTCVVPGSVFVHGFDIVGCNQLQYGFLMHSLERWQDSGGTIGGSSAKGHGRLSTSVTACEWDAAESIAIYEKHVTDNLEESRDWLSKCYEPPKKAPKKKQKALV